MTGNQEHSALMRQAKVYEPGLGKLRIAIPGSTANLGPGFDALALALNLYCTLTFEILPTQNRSVPLITLKGTFARELPTDQSNLIYAVLSKLWRGDKEVLQRLRITIESEIPPGKGLGSSAAAIMGAVWAAYGLTGDIGDDGALLLTANELEGHADNVTASLLGGLVVCGGPVTGSGTGSGARAIATQKVPWPLQWCPIVLVPGYALSTKQARAILPQVIDRADAVHNIQRTALLVAAVFNRDEDALKSALHDRLHEPYREALVPELKAVRRALKDMPVLGTVLSGAGSSVLTLVNQRHLGQVLECLEGWAQKQAKAPSVYALKVDQEGLRVSYE